MTTTAKKSRHPQPISKIPTLGKHLIHSICASVLLISITAQGTNPVLHIWVGDGPTNTASIHSAISLGYSYANQRLILSGNYPTGIPYNYYTSDTGSSPTPFGSTGGISLEGQIAVADATLNGFVRGEVFGTTYGNQYMNIVTRLNTNGNTFPSPPYSLSWVSLGSNEDLDESGMFFDSTSGPNVTAYRLWVATQTGKVYKIKSDGTYVKVLDTVGWFSSVIVVSNNLSLYGPFAGKVLVGDEGFAKLYVIDPNTFSYSAIPLTWSNADNQSTTYILPENLLVVPSRKDFWGIDFDYDRLFRISHNLFVPITGRLLITTESATSVYYNGARHVTHFWTLRYNAAAPNSLEIEPLLVIDDNTGLEFDTTLEGAAWAPH